MKDVIIETDFLIQVGLDCVYDLFAIVNHTGELNFGHYSAFCKNIEKDIWY